MNWAHLLGSAGYAAWAVAVAFVPYLLRGKSLSVFHRLIVSTACVSGGIVCGIFGIPHLLESGDSFSSIARGVSMLCAVIAMSFVSSFSLLFNKKYKWTEPRE